MIRIFRYIALFEGLTAVALFFVAMPAKYWFDNPYLVPPIGGLHGFAFIVYMLAMAVCLPRRGLSLCNWATTFVSGFVPLASFFNDRMLRRHETVAA